MLCVSYSRDMSGKARTPLTSSCLKRSATSASVAARSSSYGSSYTHIHTHTPHSLFTLTHPPSRTQSTQIPRKLHETARSAPTIAERRTRNTDENLCSEISPLCFSSIMENNSLHCAMIAGSLSRANSAMDFLRVSCALGEGAGVGAAGAEAGAAGLSADELRVRLFLSHEMPAVNSWKEIFPSLLMSRPSNSN